jgi:hypothetical protein
MFPQLMRNEHKEKGRLSIHASRNIAHDFCLACIDKGVVFNINKITSCPMKLRQVYNLSLT